MKQFLANPGTPPPVIPSKAEGSLSVKSDSSTPLRSGRNDTHRLLLSILILLSFLYLLPDLISADNLRSTDYRIDMGTINMTGGEKTSDTYRLTDTVGQTFQGRFEKNGYRIRAGFQYIHTLLPFRFSISSINVDFGIVTPQVPKTANNTLRITTGAAYGYEVQAYEVSSLKTTGGDAIPDTACDTATSCTTTDANIWSDATRYGFGYNMSGEDVNTNDFVDSSYYRPFANAELSEPAVPVMSSSGIATDSAATVTYKINIAPTQPSGRYTTIVKYLAIPSY